MGWKGYLQGMHLHCCALKGRIMVTAYIIEGVYHSAFHVSVYGSATH